MFNYSFEPSEPGRVNFRVQGGVCGLLDILYFDEALNLAAALKQQAEKSRAALEAQIKAHKIKDCTALIPRYKAFKERESAGGALHIWLSDGNIDTDYILSCLRAAREQQPIDPEAIELARLGLYMSKTQRSKIYLSL